MSRQQPTAFRFRASLSAPALLITLAAALSGCAAFANRGLLESPADARISADVRALIEQSPALGAPNLITVQTRSGVVYLRGLVSTPAQIGEAGRLAAQVPGVRQVANLLSFDNSR